MNEKEILTLLIYCNELDGRHSPNEIKVAAWFDVFRETCADMPLFFAQQVARKHYSNLDAMIAPNVFIKEWTQHKRQKELADTARDATGRHCGRGGCMCTHTEPCFKGWIDRIDNTATAPCSTCRPVLAKVLAVIPPPGMRNPGDWARVREDA